MKVLITGFDAFDNEKINPTLEVLELLPNIISGANIIKLEIPTVFKKSIEYIEKAIEEYNPDIIISMGLAGGRSVITPENVATNLDNARIKDNEGNKPVNTIIQKDGRDIYLSKLPIKEMVKNMINNDIPANISNDIGNFVCNHVMYGILYLIDKKYCNIKGGFIHIPYTSEQVITKYNEPSISLNDICKGIEICIKTVVEYNKDIAVDKLSI